MARSPTAPDPAVELVDLSQVMEQIHHPARRAGPTSHDSGRRSR